MDGDLSHCSQEVQCSSIGRQNVTLQVTLKLMQHLWVESLHICTVTQQKQLQLNSLFGSSEILDHNAADYSIAVKLDNYCSR